MEQILQQILDELKSINKKLDALTSSPNVSVTIDRQKVAPSLKDAMVKGIENAFDAIAQNYSNTDVKEVQEYDLAKAKEACNMVKNLQTGAWVVLNAYYKNTNLCPLVFVLGRIK